MVHYKPDVENVVSDQWTGYKSIMLKIYKFFQDYILYMSQSYIWRCSKQGTE